MALSSRIGVTFLVKGHGVRFIGDNISNFSDGELILLGENLPHTWRMEQESDNGHAEVIIVHFSVRLSWSRPAFVAGSVFDSQTFERAKKGLIIKGKAKEKVTKLMYQAVEAQNLDR